MSCFAFLDRFALQLLAHFVEVFEPASQIDSAFASRGGKQLDGQHRLAEPAGRVEPGRQAIADVAGAQLGAGGQSSRLAQRQETGRRLLLQSVEPIANHDAVLVVQGHDIGDDAQGGQNHRVEQEIAEQRRDLFAAALAHRQRPGQLEGDARAAQAAERVRRSRQPGVDQHGRVGQRVLHLVVVGDDQLQPQPARLLGLGQAGDAAIDRDHQFRALFRDLAKRPGVEAVALFLAMGNVDVGPGPEQVERLQEDGRAGHSVHVVIAVDVDAPALVDGVEDSLGRKGDAGQQLRGVQAVEGGVEEATGLFGDIDTAIEQQLGDQRRHLQRTGQSSNGPLVVRQQAPRLGGRCCHGGILLESGLGEGGRGVRPTAFLPGWDHRGIIASRGVPWQVSSGQ